MELNLDIEGMGKYKLHLRKGTYSNQKIALRLIDFEDGMPFATLTVNLPESGFLLGPGEFFVKTWSENAPVVEALRTQTDIFFDTGKKAVIGPGSVAEVWKFTNDSILNEIKEL